MKAVLVVTAALMAVPAAFGSGCHAASAKWEPTVRVVYMPRDFEDGRVMVNPWRDPKEVPFGPSYPYELVYNQTTYEYEVAWREKSPFQQGTQVTYRRGADPYTMIMPVRQ